MRLELADVDAVWPTIRMVAEPLIDGDDAKSNDIISECRAGRALCFACEDGAMIVTVVVNRFLNDWEMVVWLAIGRSGETDLVERYWPEVQRIAAELGARRVVFHSRRRGWERHLPPAFKLRSVSYVAEVQA